MNRRILSALSLSFGLWLMAPVALADEAKDIELVYRSGEAQKALTQADAVIAAKPRAAAVRFLKGVMLTDLKRRPEAIEVFLALTQDFPELPDPYNNLAVLYAADGQLEPALVALRQALRNDPTHLAARENLGDVHMALALQAWGSADAASKLENLPLKRKLRLAREIAESPATATAQRSPG